ncbi:mRNA turnover protein 4 [Beauveria bassiana D1-5]|uniref:Ribosome assembly factor mrt4 n=2 Tax=Beauveria bassiana TaxID=176275 RepID=J4W4A6_BEAB2|nr:ribosomal protein L10 [Beauveria bassiana ARSEF 2860]EJP65225.1 ribosomal protein L10 [Beauveria bassiana ARSEF 2860]KAF1731905.1 Ribosome assembly factor mrt4 [Beauveria bassiana]KAH8716154.1 Ribosome assembly factor mrt4 [Beauveria bassiana]KGQ12627.1 mRNA turnover protein 4 [Beauveria bassiana D1-5]
MPKSKRSRTFNLTQVNKKGREQKDKLFQNIRDAVPQYQHCFVFSVDNMRNSYLKNVRREMSDSRLFFGKTKLMAKALGQTPEEAVAPGIDACARLLAGNIGLLLTDRAPDTVLDYFDNLALVDFARAGIVAPRAFSIPPGVVYATAGEVPAEHDVPLEHTLEPELRRLGVPTRMVKGRVVLGSEDGEGEAYVVCKEGDVLDSRQTRLLKMFDVCLSEFKVKVLAYWSAESGEVTQVESSAMEQD